MDANEKKLSHRHSLQAAAATYATSMHQCLCSVGLALIGLEILTSEVNAFYCTKSENMAGQSKLMFVWMYFVYLKNILGKYIGHLREREKVNVR